MSILGFPLLAFVPHIFIVNVSIEFEAAYQSEERKNKKFDE